MRGWEGMMPLLALPISQRDPWYSTRAAYMRVRRTVEKGFWSTWRVDAWGGREARLIMKAASYIVCIELASGAVKHEGSFVLFDPAYASATGLAVSAVPSQQNRV